MTSTSTSNPSLTTLSDSTLLLRTGIAQGDLTALLTELGTSATELVHLGQTVIAGNLNVDYLVDAVFNVPTFSDAYKIAALDAGNRLNELDNSRRARAA